MQPGASLPTEAERAPGSERGWSTRLSALFLAMAVAVAAVVGVALASSADGRARQSVDGTASELAATVGTALQRDVDLVTATRALVAQDPQLTNPGLAQWFAALGATPHRDVLGATYIQSVSAQQFFFFLVTLEHDPVNATTDASTYTITPSSASPPLCLTRLFVAASGDVTVQNALAPTGLDWCATPLSPSLGTAARTDRVVVSSMLDRAERQHLGLSAGATSPSSAATGLDRAFQVVDRAQLVILPVYAGTAPETAVARQAALVGWVGVLVDPAALLDDAVATHPGVHVALARAGAPTITAGSPARPGALTSRVTIAAAGDWTLAVAQPAPAGLAAGNVQGTLAGTTIAVMALLAFVALRASQRRRRRAAELAAVRQQELHHVMLHDPLTELPNRELVRDRAEQMLARGRRNEVATAALVVGIDHMGEVNGLHGWAVGDEVLEAVGKRLAAALREADTVGRLAGDEFVVLTEGAALAAGPAVIAERLLDVLRTPFRVRGDSPNEITVSASVGAALGPRLSADDLLRDAEVALRQAKEDGAGRYVLFAQDTPQAIESRLALENELRQAVEYEEFSLRFQPIFDIDRRTTIGVEALLRWDRRNGRVLPPDHFLVHLENAGLMVPVGRWVLREACLHAAGLHERGRPISMSVNIAASQLADESLPSDVADALVASSLAPHALVLEVAEMTLLQDPEVALERMAALKALGVRLAVDGFGIGFSSIAFLRRFPIDILKIDRSLIASSSTPAESAALVHTLVELGQTLGVEVIAEGIENAGQLDPLIRANCDAGQGFLYGRPLTAAQLELFLSMHDTPTKSDLWVSQPG